MRAIIITLIGLLLSTGSFAQHSYIYDEVRKDLEIFEDSLALELKKKISRKSINKLTYESVKNVALAILKNDYRPTYLAAEYKAILDPRTLGRILSIGDGYSKYENVTGVFLQEGQHIILVKGLAEGKTVKLLVPHWLRKAPDPANPTKDPNGWGLHRQEFILKNGINLIELKSYGGLAYIGYYSDNPEGEPPIAIHFLTGEENGYFDIAKHNNEDWTRFLYNAVYPILDARGTHIQIAYPVDELKKYAYGRGVELISIYDSLVYRQHRLMGLEKYQKVPRNRILARVNFNYYMFRDGDGVAYMGDKQGYAMHMVADPDMVMKGDPCWGFSHEVGHVHQTRPMFNWGGLGEVSNNLFSMYVCRSFGNKSRLAQQKNYEKARKNIIEKRISYLADPDVFNRLVPFWQLQLYFESIGENSDFYADLFEELRRQAAKQQEHHTSSGRRRAERNPAIHQLNFIKTACKVSQVDLTDFFEKYGFFYVGRMEYEDYGRYVYEMTQEMVDKCLQEIKAMNLPKPKVDISSLTD